MLHRKMQYVYVGADSHKDTHTIVVLDCFYEKLGEFVIPNRPSAFDDFLQKVSTYCESGIKPAFGFEDTVRQEVV